ncbi:MAG: peptidoglycan DD-metalloendopeptidase family protein [Candidatus Gracilibacteria bacterium]|nr:peptidoglycan DD-metalloendopeptidase family protein [Candidatus Gracilibacteria bacterium]
MRVNNFREKYFLSTWILRIFLFLFYILSVNNSFLYTSVLNYKNITADPFNGATTPIKYTLNYLTTTSADRLKKFTDIDSSKFISLPNYDKNILGRDLTGMLAGNPQYDETILLRSIYLVPYMGNYNHDGQEYAGSHLAVDIKAPTGTPVYSIANGVVIKVGYEKGGFGNYVVIRHENVNLVDGTIQNIYSAYCHLDTVTITEGTKISKDEPIGTVGESGLAVGSHLHFQIDLETAPFHPYWPFTGAEQSAAGLDFFSAISSGLGKAKAMLYTINPFEFISKNLVKNTDNENKTDNVVVKDETQVALAGDNVDLTSGNTAENNQVKTDSGVLENNVNTITETGTEIGTKTGTETEINTGTKELVATEDKLALESNIDVINYLDSSKNIVLKDDYIYTDVYSENKYFEAIKYFKNNGTINGFADGSFKPDQDITRIESLKIILNAFSYDRTENHNYSFDDINTDSWQNYYVQKGISLQVIDNTTNKLFYPGRTLNRIEALKLIISLKGDNMDNYKDKNYEFKDISKDDWYYKYAAYAIENKLFSIENGEFVPDSSVTRGEMLDIMYKIINLKN